MFVPTHILLVRYDRQESWLLCLGYESFSTVEQAYLKLDNHDSSRKDDENNDQDIKVRRFTVWVLSRIIYEMELRLHKT